MTMSRFPWASPSRTSVSITNSPPSLDTISRSRTRAATITTSPTPLHHNDRLVSTTPPLSTTPTPPNDPTPTPSNDPIFTTPPPPHDPIFTTPPPPNDPISTTPTCPNDRLLSAEPEPSPLPTPGTTRNSSSSPSGSSLPPPGTSKSSPPPSSSSASTGLVVGITIGSVVILAILSILFIWCKKKKRRDHDDYVLPSHGPKGKLIATNFLGQGGFGYVHKGVLPNGKEVAIKQLKAGSGQGEREFQAEVEIISRVHHKHLVSLVGYCITGSQRMLVYEFVPNNTMEFHLHAVVRAFEGDISLSDLNEAIKPGHNTVYSSHGSSDYDTNQYNEDMKKFRKMALGTKEYGSNEHSALTSEYGLYPSGSSSGGQQTTPEMEMGKMCGR
ncbi:unnamed protein product [Camellia sinensis]